MKNEIFGPDFTVENPEGDFFLDLCLKSHEEGMKDGFRGIRCEIPIGGFRAHFYVQGFISGCLKKVQEMNSPVKDDKSWWYLLP